MRRSDRLAGIYLLIYLLAASGIGNSGRRRQAASVSVSQEGAAEHLDNGNEDVPAAPVPHMIPPLDAASIRSLSASICSEADHGSSGKCAAGVGGSYSGGRGLDAPPASNTQDTAGSGGLDGSLADSSGAQPSDSLAAPVGLSRGMESSAQPSGAPQPPAQQQPQQQALEACNADGQASRATSATPSGSAASSAAVADGAQHPQPGRELPQPADVPAAPSGSVTSAGVVTPLEGSTPVSPTGSPAVAAPAPSQQAQAQPGPGGRLPSNEVSTQTPAEASTAQQQPAPPPQQQQQPPTPQDPPASTDAALASPAPAAPVAVPTPQHTQATAPPPPPPQPEQRKRGPHTAIPKPDEFVMSIPTPDLSLTGLGAGAGDAGVSGGAGGAATQLGFNEDVFVEGHPGVGGEGDQRIAAGECSVGSVPHGGDLVGSHGSTVAPGGPSTVAAAAAAGGAISAVPDVLLEDEEEGRKINLASASDGASIVASNKEAKRPERLIDGDDDSYMKNTCSASKWVIVELSQLGRVDEIKLTMKEMYSSRVKDFMIKGRQSHPKKDGLADYARGLELDGWQLLGLFHAENRKGSQVFRLPRKARVRYLLLQVLSHYGSEEMCALNSLEVRGVTAAQELEAALSRPLSTHPPPPVATGAQASATPQRNVGSAAAAPAAATASAQPAAAAATPATQPATATAPPPDATPSVATAATTTPTTAATPSSQPAPAQQAPSGSTAVPGRDAIPLPPAHPAAEAASQSGGGQPPAATAAGTGGALEPGLSHVAACQPQQAGCSPPGSNGVACGDAAEPAAQAQTGASGNKVPVEAAGQQAGPGTEAPPVKEPVSVAAGAHAVIDESHKPGQAGSCSGQSSGSWNGGGAAAEAPSTVHVADIMNSGVASTRAEPPGCGAPPGPPGAANATTGSVEVKDEGSGAAATALAVAVPWPVGAEGSSCGAKPAAPTCPAAAAAAGGDAPPPLCPSTAASAATGQSGANATTPEAVQTGSSSGGGASGASLPANETGSCQSADTKASAAHGQGAPADKAPLVGEAVPAPGSCSGSDGNGVPKASKDPTYGSSGSEAAAVAKTAQDAAVGPHPQPNASGPGAGGEAGGSPACMAAGPPAASGGREAASGGGEAASGGGEAASGGGRDAAAAQGLRPGAEGAAAAAAAGAADAGKQAGCVSLGTYGGAAYGEQPIPPAAAAAVDGAQRGAAKPMSAGSAANAADPQDVSAGGCAAPLPAAGADGAAGVKAPPSPPPQPSHQQVTSNTSSPAPAAPLSAPSSSQPKGSLATAGSTAAHTAAAPSSPATAAAAQPAGAVVGTQQLTGIPASPPPVSSPSEPATATQPAASANHNGGAAAAAAGAAALAPATAAAANPTGSASAGVPAAAAVPTLDSLLSVLDAGAASKPRVAGNLFDVVKQEMMMLKLNQTRLWQYIHALVDALNARHAELEADAQAMEDKIALLEQEIVINADAIAQAREAPVAPLAALAARVTDLEERARRAEAFCKAVLQYSCGTLLFVAAAVLPLRRLGFMKWVIVLMAAAVCIVGSVGDSEVVKSVLAGYSHAALGNAAELLAHAGDVLRWKR